MRKRPEHAAHQEDKDHRKMTLRNRIAAQRSADFLNML